MKKVMLIMALVLSGCSSHDNTVHTLQAAGYTNITTDGYSFFGCGKDDTYHTKFTATGPTGVRVNGVVCSGVFKGSTIRID